MKLVRAALLNRSGGHARPFAQSAPLTITTVGLAAPRHGELLVEIDAAGLCHSDLSVVDGSRVRPMPMALGHEATGIIRELGPGGDAEFTIGDRVVLVFLPACGTCRRCEGGEPWLCTKGAEANGKGELLTGGRRLHHQGTPLHHHLGVSAFASHAVVDRRSAVKIAADIPAEIAALFGCAVLTGVGAAINTAAIRPGESVMIFGLGGVGLSALMGAAACGGSPLMAIDPSTKKQVIAYELGALCAAPEAVGSLLTHLPEDGADVVIDTVGTAAALRQAFACARRGGRVISVGLPAPDDLLDLPALAFAAEGKSLIGSYMGSSVPARDIPRYVALWREGRLPVERLLTSVSPLCDLNMLLDRLADGDAIRQIVVPQEQAA